MVGWVKRSATQHFTTRLGWVSFQYANLQFKSILGAIKHALVLATQLIAAVVNAPSRVSR
ncbi:MAG TPA: hypothetical protein DCE56_34800 [Cyanobacteria bacterium UBA8553]|nr:hypothetical protein [Cyanobacteria bacterium UBA8553]